MSPIHKNRRDCSHKHPRHLVLIVFFLRQPLSSYLCPCRYPVNRKTWASFICKNGRVKTKISLLTWKKDKLLFINGVEFFRASNAASQWLIQDNWTTSESDHNQDFMTLISMELHPPVPKKFARLAGSLLAPYEDTNERLCSRLQLQEMKFACTWN